MQSSWALSPAPLYKWIEMPEEVKEGSPLKFIRLSMKFHFLTLYKQEILNRAECCDNPCL